jgi:hypothetical protein
MNSIARIRDLKWYRNPQFQALHDKTIIQGHETSALQRRHAAATHSGAMKRQHMGRMNGGRAAGKRQCRQASLWQAEGDLR